MLLLQSNDDDGKGLVEMVMDLLGIDPNSIGEDDNLAGMGIDSMQARIPSFFSWALTWAGQVTCCSAILLQWECASPVSWGFWTELS